MPKISTSTSIIVPAGQRLMIQGIGAQATATVNPGSLGQIYDVSANGQDFFGPFDRATTVFIQINGGAVNYRAFPDLMQSELVYRDEVGGTASTITSTGDVIIKQITASKLLAKIESSRSGVGPLLIAISGDSNTTGTGAGTGTVNMEGSQKWSVGAQLVKILDRTFMYTTNDCFFGDQNATAGGITVQQYDTRFSAFGAGWSQDASPASFGGRMFVGASGGAGALTFTPARPWNRVRLLLGTFASGATSITAKAGGVSMGTTTNRGAAALGDTTFSTGAAATVQAFSVDTVTGGIAYVVGAIFWDSENPGCVVCPGGWYGGLISNMNDTTWPWSHRPVAVALGAGLHITNVTINNADAGTAIATYTAAALAFHQALAASGDVLITGMTPSFSGSSVPGRLDEYENALISIAQSIATPFSVVDWRDQFGGTYAIANAAGWMRDGAHLKGVGYARQAAVEAKEIISAVQSI